MLSERPDGPLRLERLSDPVALYDEPFYPLIRQQLLAWSMECTHELGADVVHVLRVAPPRNTALRRVIALALPRLKTIHAG